MGLSADTIATSIAGLSISGVTVKDLDEIPQVGSERVAVLMPDPGAFLTDLVVTRESYGGASAKKNATYTLHYVYLHAPVGQGRGLRDVYPGLVTNVCAILDALIDNDALSGCIDQYPEAVSVSIVTDPSGQQFYGCPLAFRVLEYVEV